MTQCPYLSSIQRHLLDFDFQEICSISLSINNVYCCLVCGRYLQGRSSNTAAYRHSIDHRHHVYICLTSGRIYCLPDGYQVETHTVVDIVRNLNPTYDQESIQALLTMKPKYGVQGNIFIPGAIGLNNLKGTDYFSSVIQLLNTVEPLRNWFLLLTSEQHQLIDNQNGDTKGECPPSQTQHKQQLPNVSSKDIPPTKRVHKKPILTDPLSTIFGRLLRKMWNPANFKGIVSPHQFMQVVMDRSNRQFRIGHQSDPVKFIVWLLDNLDRVLKKEKADFKVMSLFQGRLKTSYVRGLNDSAAYESTPSKVEEKPFTVLRLTFPDKGIFNKVENVVPLRTLLDQYMGQAGVKYQDGLLFMRVTQFPRYLLIALKRFTETQYGVEVDRSELLYGEQFEICSLHYRLIAQICHQGAGIDGNYSCMCKVGGKWFEMRDLEVNQILQKQMLLGAPYLQLYERVDKKINKESEIQEK